MCVCVDCDLQTAATLRSDASLIGTVFDDVIWLDGGGSVRSFLRLLLIKLLRGSGDDRLERQTRPDVSDETLIEAVRHALVDHPQCLVVVDDVVDEGVVRCLDQLAVFVPPPAMMRGFAVSNRDDESQSRSLQHLRERLVGSGNQ